MRERLIVVAKSPGTAPAGSRLVGVESPWLRASSLYESFLADTLNVARHASLNADVWLASSDTPDSRLDAPTGVVRVKAEGGEHGERLSRLSAQAFEQGYRAAVLVGADCPHLPVSFVQEAFGRLRFGFDVALGPAAGGGFYLLGLSAPRPQLFAGGMGFAEVGGLRTAFLPTLYDIGAFEDARRLWRDLRRGVADAPESRRALYTLFERGAESPPQSIEEKS